MLKTYFGAKGSACFGAQDLPPIDHWGQMWISGQKISRVQRNAVHEIGPLLVKSHAFALFQGEQRAEYFVQDFVLTELIDLDINEIFYLKNPMGLLTAILEKTEIGTPEAR